jgi:hypothetical protein
MTGAHTLECSTTRPPAGGAASEAEVRMDMPDDHWTIAELYGRAAWEVGQIGKSRRCSPRYWYFGKSMLLVQQQVANGGWKAWCAARHIPADRWKRGRLLALAFASPDALADLTIEAATNKARELLGIQRRRTAADARIRRSLVRMRKSLEKHLEGFAQITRAAGLRSQIAAVRQMLVALDNAAAALEGRDSVLALPRRAKRPK